MVRSRMWRRWRVPVMRLKESHLRVKFHLFCTISCRNIPHTWGDRYPISSASHTDLLWFKDRADGVLFTRASCLLWPLRYRTGVVRQSDHGAAQRNRPADQSAVIDDRWRRESPNPNWFWSSAGNGSPGKTTWRTWSRTGKPSGWLLIGHRSMGLWSVWTRGWSCFLFVS